MINIDDRTVKLKIVGGTVKRFRTRMLAKPFHKIIPKLYKGKVLNLSASFQKDLFNQMLQEEFLKTGLPSKGFTVSHYMAKLENSSSKDYLIDYIGGSNLRSKPDALELTLGWEAEKELPGWKNLGFKISAENIFAIRKSQTLQEVINNPLQDFRLELEFIGPCFDKCAENPETRSIMEQYFGDFQDFPKWIPAEESPWGIISNKGFEKIGYAKRKYTSSEELGNFFYLGRKVEGCMNEFDNMMKDPSIEERIEHFRRQEYEKRLGELNQEFSYE